MARIASLAATALCLSFGTAAAHAVECRSEPEIDLMGLKSRLVVISEGTHGTSEAPAFVGGVLCEFSKAGRPVILALESPRDKQAAINEFMNSAGTDVDKERLVAAVLRQNDGRGSLAILAMLDTARSLRKAGSKVAVSLVDAGEPDVLLPLYSEDKYGMWSQSRRQVLMAANVQARLDQYPDHAVLFFTSHASRTIGALGEGYESATLLLSRLMPVYVLGLSNRGGEAWRCQGKTLPEVVCKAYNVQADIPQAGADRTFNLGFVSASPPASANPHPIYVPASGASK